MSPVTWCRLVVCAAVLAVVAVPGWTDSPKDKKADGKKYALLVGVCHYQNDDFPPLRFPVNDVVELAETLKGPSAGFPSENVRVLTTPPEDRTRKEKPRGEKNAATAANIEKALDELLRDKGKEDTILLALAGHGVQLKVKDPRKKRPVKTLAFFCPTDAQLDDTDYNKETSPTLINLDHLFNRLSKCQAGVKLLIMDACRNDVESKDKPRARGIGEKSTNLDPDAMKLPGGTLGMFSCRRDQQSWEVPKLKHGAFSYFLLQGLRGKAKDPRTGEVTWGLLADYVARQMESEVPTLVGGGAVQTPHTFYNKPGRSPVVAKYEPSAGDEEALPPKAIINSIGMKLAGIPAGSFLMGSTDEERKLTLDGISDDDIRGRFAGFLPQERLHEVRLTKPFHMGMHEVTQAQYRKVMGKNPSWFSATGKGADKVTGLDTSDFPVDSVSWADADAFCRKLSALPAEKAAGRAYRLPTEAEWEYACRAGGPPSVSFHFGKTLSLSQANFGFIVGDRESLGRTSRVGKFNKPNAWGLHDMHGNVYEWCLDWYDEDYYRKSDKTKDPRGPSTGRERVCRGGAWNTMERFCRAAYRSYGKPNEGSRSDGFRVVCVPAPGR
jgi:formylglycine-generating enzyme required for sulfatase activity/uncharacterized caspase-like protein